MMPKIFLILSILALTACVSLFTTFACDWYSASKTQACLEEKFPSPDSKEIEEFLLSQGFFKLPPTERFPVDRYMREFHDISIIKRW